MTTAKSRSTDESIAQELQTNFIVEAGAGTGKTYALCSRVVALVKTGVPMREIVAITFTEAMATELGERIRSRMEQLLDDQNPANSEDLLAHNLSDAEKAHIRRAIDELDQAAIQTIHSFAAQLLRERPLAAKLPPGWVVLDEVAAAEWFAERWDWWLEKALSGGADRELQDSLRYLVEENVQIDRWRDIAANFSAYVAALRSENSIDINLPEVDLSVAIAEALQTLYELCDQDRNRPGESASLLDQLSAAIEVLKSAQDVSNDPAAVAKAIRGRNVGPTGRGGNQSVRAGFAEAGNTLKANIAAACLREYVVPLLINFREEFTIQFEAQRRAAGVATFDDLLVWARDLLRDDVESRRYFQLKYSHILIDEFQDTDPLQAEIAFYLASQPDVDIPGQPWHKLPLKPGGLFIVGDVKQSIYRFRGADIGVTELVRANPVMKPLTLTENRRSRKPVLNWVNDIFADLMKGQSHQAAYVALGEHSQGQSGGLEGSVRVFGEPAAKGSAVDEIRRQQADHIAQVIVESIGENASNRLSVYDRAQGCVRGAKLQDVSILVRSRTGLNILTRTLDGAEIPYRLEGGSLLFDTQEVQDLINCLRAIDDPTDEVSVVAALRSPAFACSDVDLLAWRDAGGSWNYLSPLLSNDELGTDDRTRRERLQSVPRVWTGMRRLREYHQKRRTGRVSQLIADFCRELRLDELDVAEYRPRETWRRRQYLVEQARQLEHTTGSDQGSSPITLHRFIRWAQLRQEENTRIAETVVPEPDDDAVRIMTIHAAKGQEFPIVILLGLDHDPTDKRGPHGYPTVLSHPSKRTIEVLAGSWNRGNGLMTPGYPSASKEHDEHATSEMVRLAYVGATRARDHLLVSLYQSEDASKKDNNVVAAGIERMRASLEEKKRHVDWPVAKTPTGKYKDGSVKSTPAQLAEYDLEAWRKNRVDNIVGRSMPQAITATRIAGTVAPSGAELEDKDSDSNPERLGRRGRGGTAFGTAVHAVLQETVDQLADRLPLTDDDVLDALLAEMNPGVEQIAERHADGPHLSDRQSEIVGLANGALRSPAVEAALRAPRQWSEVPVAASIPTPRGPVVIEGIIDLLYQDGDGQFVILDYKSDWVDSERDVDAKLEHYRMQGVAYAAAVETATGQRVKAVQFLFIRRKDGLREIENIRELIDRIPELIDDRVG